EVVADGVRVDDGGLATLDADRVERGPKQRACAGEVAAAGERLRDEQPVLPAQQRDLRDERVLRGQLRPAVAAEEVDRGDALGQPVRPVVQPVRDRHVPCLAAAQGLTQVYGEA